MIETSLIGFSRGEESDSFFHAVNPVTGDNLDVQYGCSSESEVERAGELAHLAAQPLASLSGSEKAKFLLSVADRIDAAVEELVITMTLETALPEGRVRGETGRTSGQLRMFAKLLEEGSWVDARIDRAIPDREPVPKPDLRAMLRPIGPVAVFCASNFPLAFSVAGGDTASALAAGCPVIVKAHHAHPGTALIVGRLVVEAVLEHGLPEGTFSLIFGEGRTIGQAIVKNPRLKAVGFTGSREGGRALFDLASNRTEPIPVFAEMSSVNPLFLMPELDEGKMQEIAEGLFTSATMGVGQFCTNPGIVFYPNNEMGAIFRNSFVEKMKTFGTASMLHKGICDSYLTGIKQISNQAGVEELFQSETHHDNSSAVGSCVLNTDVECFLSNPALSDEVFGPATLLVSYSDSDELIKVAQGMEGQLTASLFGTEESLNKNESILDILETKVGRMLFNQFPTGVEVCPSIIHGGPYPATTDSRSTSVGTAAILRFVRPVCYQGFPEDLLPLELRDSNPLKINRTES